MLWYIEQVPHGTESVMAMSPTERPPLLQLTRCPECGATAEITRRIVLASSDGPIEHVRMQCVDRHWFLLPSAMLAGMAPAVGTAATTDAAPAPEATAVTRRP